jgi:hypothetical protein
MILGLGRDFSRRIEGDLEVQIYEYALYSPPPLPPKGLITVFTPASSIDSTVAQLIPGKEILFMARHIK